MNLPKYGPKKHDHPSIGIQCQVCKEAFKEGDYTTLVEIKPASAEDAEKKRQGRAYNAEAAEIHYHCAPVYE